MNANLSELISQSVAAKLDSAFIEKEVETRVAKLVSEAVDSALRSYSDTGKLIREKVEEALRVDRIDLPTYGATVANILKAQIEVNVSELIASRLAADMDELLSLAPKQVKLSDIAKAMIEQGDHGVDFGEAITVIVEHAERGYSHIYLDEVSLYGRNDKYRCRHQLHVDPEGSIYSATVDNVDLKSTKRIGRSYGIDQKLRAYVACGTKLILDEDDVIIGVGDY